MSVADSIRLNKRVTHYASLGLRKPETSLFDHKDIFHHQMSAPIAEN